MATLNYIPSTECSVMHNLKLTADMFCLYGQAHMDSCSGDSGGGVLWNGYEHLDVLIKKIETAKTTSVIFAIAAMICTFFRAIIVLFASLYTTKIPAASVPSHNNYY